MNTNAESGFVFFGWLRQIADEKEEIHTAYVSMRRLLEKACRELTREEPVFFPTLFARLNYVCRNRALHENLTYRINAFRIRANHVLHEDLKPGETDYLQDLRALSDFFEATFATPVPADIATILPDIKMPVPASAPSRIVAMRGEVVGKENDILLVLDADNPGRKPWRVKTHVHKVNTDFNATAQLAWIGCQINLLESTTSEEGELVPEMLVLEPDFLMDITAIAETYKEYGSHPLNFFADRFQPVENTKHKIKGSIANTMFDRYIASRGDETYHFDDLMKEVFRQSAFDLTTCKDLTRRSEEENFFEELRLQKQHIESSVQTWFKGGSHGLDREKAIVEPSFLCEKLGLQGRMDFIHKDFDALVELKSGKANESIQPYETKQNHVIQLLLYLAVMKYSLGKNPDEIKAYIYYSRYPMLLQEKASSTILKKALNLRNCILAYDYKSLTEEDFARQMIRKINPDTLNIHQLSGRFWQDYLAPQIAAFSVPFAEASPLELDYFFAFYTFTVREQYLAKLQVQRIDDGREGSYWTDFNAKKESGDILFDLTIAPDGNRSDGADGISSVTFILPPTNSDILPNFRAGDIVLFYERLKKEDNATTKQVFKGTVARIDEKTLHVVMKFRQANAAVIPEQSRFAVEHDFMDSFSLVMFRSLYAFLRANADRKALILNPKPILAAEDAEKLEETGTMAEIVSRARASKGLFLLSGPPGTGKTSMALKALVEDGLRSNPDFQILLLSYTNRAVDEICETLEHLEGHPTYIRIGSALSSDEAYHHRLLDKKLAETASRAQVRALISECRIFTGTIASVNHKPGLFQLKTFDLAIIDEASQILEPALLGILCAKDLKGHNAVRKIIMIGDTRQLPAVVLQDKTASEVQLPSLLDIGLRDRSESLFERWNRMLDGSPAVATLHRQGRMHEEIAEFPNQSFYGGRLSVVPTPVQLQELPFIKNNPGRPLQEILSRQRLLFIPSAHTPVPPYKGAQAAKIQPAEALIVAAIVSELDQLCSMNGITLTGSEKPGSDSLSIGIITPYRRQVALIRASLRKLNLAIAESITIDTVERYQGSQRDIILYSLCLNTSDQLDHVTSNITEGEITVDRKLNVALTRAKQQLILTGNPLIMEQNRVFSQWMTYMKNKNAIVDTEIIQQNNV